VYCFAILKSNHAKVLPQFLDKYPLPIPTIGLVLAPDWIAQSRFTPFPT